MKKVEAPVMMDEIMCDVPGQAAYWKRHHNAPAGKGTVEQHIQSWHAYMGAPQ